MSEKVSKQFIENHSDSRAISIRTFSKNRDKNTKQQNNYKTITQDNKAKQLYSNRQTLYTPGGMKG